MSLQARSQATPSVEKSPLCSASSSASMTTSRRSREEKASTAKSTRERCSGCNSATAIRIMSISCGARRGSNSKLFLALTGSYSIMSRPPLFPPFKLGDGALSERRIAVQIVGVEDRAHVAQRVSSDGRDLGLGALDHRKARDRGAA